MPEIVHPEHGVDGLGHQLNHHLILIEDPRRAGVHHASAVAIVQIPVVNRNPRDVSLRLEFQARYHLLTSYRDRRSRSQRATLRTPVNERLAHSIAAQVRLKHSRAAELRLARGIDEKVIPDGVLADRLKVGTW